LPWPLRAIRLDQAAAEIGFHQPALGVLDRLA
jgi:hypothetical protein